MILQMKVEFLLFCNHFSASLSHIDWMGLHQSKEESQKEKLQKFGQSFPHKLRGKCDKVTKTWFCNFIHAGCLFYRSEYPFCKRNFPSCKIRILYCVPVEHHCDWLIVFIQWGCRVLHPMYMIWYSFENWLANT